MKILFTGGGTLGPVTPLLATARALKHLDHQATFVWIGTEEGPERPVIEAEDISFHTLPSVKWPRYPSWQWLTFPFRWARVRTLARDLVRKLKPDVVVTVGGFTAVPVALAAAKLGIPCVTHQLDVEPGMANRAIANVCASVTTSFEYRTPPFGDRVSDEPLATPSRYSLKDLPSKTEGRSHFHFTGNKPTVLVFGGGTGSMALNGMVSESLDEWLQMAHVIHVTGKGRDVASEKHAKSGYVKKELLDAKEMLLAYAAADVVVCRAGLGAMSEIAALKKAVILVPIPDSQQRANAKAFEEQGAAIVIEQAEDGFASEIKAAVRLLLADEETQEEMGEAAHLALATDDGTAFAKRIIQTVKDARQAK